MTEVLHVALSQVAEDVARLVEGQWTHAAHISGKAAGEHHNVLGARLSLLVPEEQGLASHEDASEASFKKRKLRKKIKDIQKIFKDLK